MSVAEVPLRSHAVTATHGWLGHTIVQMALGLVHSVLGPRPGGYGTSILPFSTVR